MDTQKNTATPNQIRMAQDLACELGHLNQGIESLWSLYKSAPALLEACKGLVEQLEYVLETKNTMGAYSQLAHAKKTIQQVEA
jgi:hypothetical protein